MKKILILLLALFAASFFSGCGEDGEPGEAYISFDWDWYVDYYNDNNYDVPGTIYEYTNYWTSPGTYSYDYGCSDGAGNFWGYYGTYTITINPGEEGSMFTDGDDGEDNYFRFSMSGNGTSFYLLKENPEKIKKESLNEVNELDLSQYDKVDVGPVEVEVQNTRKGQMVIKRQLYQLVPKQ
jgi:hypothetical protein